jgi:hypothetical protein
MLPVRPPGDCMLAEPAGAGRGLLRGGRCCRDSGPEANHPPCRMRKLGISPPKAVGRQLQGLSSSDARMVVQVVGGS